MRSPLLPGLLGLFAVLLIWTSYQAVLFNGSQLSPQGCRMSYMYPNYVLMNDFNSSWSKLATRYSLWLYREGDGWDTRDLTGFPVLFLPGNAGSHHQVRSIASSAATQYFASRGGIVSHEFSARNAKPLDVFTAKFNEDLSAFHGPTLKAQVDYVKAAIKFILSKYPPGTQIVLLGHSMGGVAAVSTLPHSSVAAVLTLSSPLRLAPVRYSREMEVFYDSIKSIIADPAISTPIISICGGVTDLMIPAETCMLSPSLSPATRRSVLSSALDGCWTGVGHQVSVWCHQLRWVVARILLDMTTPAGKLAPMKVADKWLLDRPVPMFQSGDVSITKSLQRLRRSERLAITGIAPANTTYLIPLSNQDDLFTILFADGTPIKENPREKFTETITIGYCRGAEALECSRAPELLVSRIPNPPPGTPFPLKDVGVGESEGVLVAELDLTSLKPFPSQSFIAVAIEPAKNVAKSWLMGSVSERLVVTAEARVWSLLFGGVAVSLPTHNMQVGIHLKGAPISSLIVYRASMETDASCSATLLPPVLLYHAGAERQFHFLEPNKIYLHTHTSAPFLPSLSTSPLDGIQLRIYASDCPPVGIQINVDIYASLGRAASRYFGAVACWCVAIVALMILRSWIAWEKGGLFLTLQEAMQATTSDYMLPALVVVFALSFVPSEEWFLLGNRGAAVNAVLAPVILTTSWGCVWILNKLLAGLLHVAGMVGAHQNQGQETRTGIRSLVHILAVVALTSLLVPYQVVFVACFLLQLWTCASSKTADGAAPERDSHNQRASILLLLFALLPSMAPSLAVWVRTVATTKSIALFGSDHSAVPILPVLFLVESSSSGIEPLFSKSATRVRNYLLRGSLLAVAAVSIGAGARYPYMVYDSAMASCVLLSLYCWIR